MSNFPMSFETKHFRFVNYTLLSEYDLQSILQARNHPEIACWMENTEPISWESHINYVRSLKEKFDRIYYGVFNKEGEIIGSQSLNPLKTYIEGESGLYLFPDFKGKGLGKLMKKEFIEYIFDNNLLNTITEKVKHSNIRNKELNISLGFELTNQDEKYSYFILTKERYLMLIKSSVK